MNTLNEADEEATAKHDDQMPQLFSQSSIDRQNKQNEITSIISSTPERPPGPLLEETNNFSEEEAVTSKNPRVLNTIESTTSENSTAAEEIGSDDG